MVLFPHAKINLGLHVLRKRADGFHDIETILYPIAWTDALEVVTTGSKDITLEVSGEKVDGKAADNLVYKALRLLADEYDVPGLHVHLYKNIPMGAGLGGGSSDASHALLLANQLLKLGIAPAKLHQLAGRLGSDCPFFLQNLPCVAEGRGEKLTPISVDLSGYYILVLFPGIHSDTAAAYAAITPHADRRSVSEIVRLPVAGWKNTLVNDFEAPVCTKFPRIRALIDSMYTAGAIYAAMSGSGSAVFGLFLERPPRKLFTGRYFLQEPRAMTL